MENRRHAVRKAPQQARSKATVDAVMEAAARILGTRGWAGFNTNAVAAVAGISIGSFYQYFPDKHALLAAIRDRHLADCLAAVERAVDGETTLAALAERLVDALIAVHSVHPGLHRVLLDEVPNSLSVPDPESDFERAYLGRYAEIVQRFRPGTSEEITMASATLLSDAVDGVIHNAARRDTLGAATTRTELIRLVRSYLGCGS